MWSAALATAQLQCLQYACCLTSPTTPTKLLPYLPTSTTTLQVYWGRRGGFRVYLCYDRPVTPAMAER